MAPSPPTRTPPPAAEPAGVPKKPSARPESRSWFLARLDSLLSKPLREAPPVERVRHRIVVGAASALLFFDLLYVFWRHLVTRVPAVGVFIALGYTLTLILARRSRRITAAATALLVTLGGGLVAGLFTSTNPYGGSHAAAMLLPALAVYLLRPRQALIITVVLSVTLGVVYPLYITYGDAFPGTPPPADLWFVNGFAGISYLGAWGLSILHGVARDSAQGSLEQTLKELNESQRNLRSLIESTDDVVLSVNLEGRLLTANASARNAYEQVYGRKLEPGQLLFPPDMGGEMVKIWGPRLAQVLQGQRLRLEEEVFIAGARMVVDVRVSPIIGEDGQTVGLTMFSRDITPRKEAEARLGEMHRTLVDVSRQAGMAEIATGVLHNVGNTLNSVNISTALVTDQLRKSRLNGLAKAIQLLREHSADFGAFLTKDPQGQKLPGYLIALSDQLQEERESLLKEMGSLSESVDHIKSVVSMQQKHARAAGAVEELAVPQLIDEALRLHAVSYERLGIRIERDYGPVPMVTVDRHKLLQILINLLGNARDALVASQREDKVLGIRVHRAPEGALLRIEVTDNGVGISPENLSRMFTQGFTTKKEGHGFGLHISALAAEEMRGRLACASPGPGQGATFTLELPLEPTA